MKAAPLIDATAALAMPGVHAPQEAVRGFGHAIAAAPLDRIMQERDTLAAGAAKKLHAKPLPSRPSTNLHLTRKQLQ